MAQFRTFVLALAVVVLSIPAAAQQAAETVTLRVSRVRKDGERLILTLPSGTEVWVAASDVVSSAAPAAAVNGIRAHCAKAWPDDFALRAFCERQQRTASDALAARRMATPDRRTIRTKCSAADWPDDLALRNFCEEQQLKALDDLAR